MNDQERQRTMDFILRQQAQFTAGMQKLEEQQTQFSAGMQKLEEQQTQFAAGLQGTNNRLESLGRVVVLVARQFRRERKDLRERIAALVNAQIKTEENLSRSDERLTRLEDITRSTSENIRALTAATERNSEDIRALTAATERNGEDIRALTTATERDRENISALADMIDKMFRGRGGNGDGS
jgi:chromosome segregation ATPase